jgi:hypothetical protein
MVSAPAKKSKNWNNRVPASSVKAQTWLLVLLLLLLLLSRVAALDALPLHNDEGLHLTRAVEVWRGHPFWEIRDGKIVNHWAIAVFYPQHAPVFAARLPTVLIGLIGLASAYILVYTRFGLTAALLAGGLWIASPYLFFYERLGFSDAEAGALVVVALLAALRLARTNRPLDAALTGLALALAALFKFTAVPFSLSVALIVLLLSRAPFARRLMLLMIVGVVVAACFAVPIGYLLLRGGDFFGIALGWIGGGSGGDPAFMSNLARLWATLTGYGSALWAMAMIAGLVGVAAFGGHLERTLLAAVLLPLLIMMLFGREVLPRHYVVALPAALMLGGAGLGMMLQKILSPHPPSPSPKVRGVETQGRLLEVPLPLGEGFRVRAKGASTPISIIAFLALLALLAFGFVPFAAMAYSAPGDLPLPQEERRQFVTEHSGGFGLREAVQDFPNTVADELPVIGSMFPDGCRRANFYAVDGREMICTDAPGLPQIEAALAEYGAAYVLADTPPHIGADMEQVGEQLSAEVARVKAYPRPGESEETATVALWRVAEAISP